MAKLKRWNWTEANRMVNTGTRKRLLMAGELIATEVRTKLKGQIGKGKTTGISRPVYKTGVHRGQPWTQRNFGELLNSIRVVEKIGSWGFEIKKEETSVFMPGIIWRIMLKYLNLHDRLCDQLGGRFYQSLRRFFNGKGAFSRYSFC